MKSRIIIALIACWIVLIGISVVNTKPLPVVESTPVPTVMPGATPTYLQGVEIAGKEQMAAAQKYDGIAWTGNKYTDQMITYILYGFAAVAVLVFIRQGLLTASHKVFGGG